MKESDFEGTLVLEKLASVGKVEEFFDAVDSDNLKLAVALLRSAQVDLPTINTVVKMICDPDRI